MINYFINYMLKHHPQELTAEMLEQQEKCLTLLQTGEKINLWPGAWVEMRKGRITTIDTEAWE